jgi:hypothetical protein
MVGNHDAARSFARVTAPLAWSLCLLCVALAVGWLLLGLLNGRTAREIFVDEAIVSKATLVVTFAVVGALVASHRPGNPIGWMFCAAALFQSLANSGYEYATYALLTNPGSLPLGAEASWLAQWIWAPGLGLFVVFLPLLFPNGRPPSRRWRPVAWLGGLSVAMIVVPGMILLWPERGAALVRPEAPAEKGTSHVFFMVVEVAVPLMFLAGLGAVVSLFVRFRRARGDERQQIKWFAAATALTLTFVFVVDEVLRAESGPLEVIVALSALLVVPTIPIATGIAILKHRLYDVDVIINRTLVYGALTVSLALVYFGGVVSLQYAFRALTGEGSQLVVVASTLTIAALVNPLRHRIQGFVDRCFYRKKYDAAQVLAGFSSKLRDATDLDALSDDLVAVVRETVQPGHVSLWLKPAGDDRRSAGVESGEG